MTKGYIYTMYKGADPGYGWTLNDPIFSRKRATLGACMPNIRRSVSIGDYVFVISGRVLQAQQYVVGGFRVQEKLDHLAAFHKFPEYRLQQADDGSQTLGNIIVDTEGNHHPLDDHENFERRIENYLVGDNQVFVEKPECIERARAETLPMLEALFEKKGNRVIDVMGRHRKLDEQQVKKLVGWLETLA